MIQRIKGFGRQLKQEVDVYRLIMTDPRTPWMARLLLGLAVGYLLLPFDLIPDFVPIIGHVDDLIVVPALVLLSLKLVPEEIVQDCRRRTQAKQLN